MIKAVIFDSDGMLTHGNRFSDTYAKEHGVSIDEMDPFFDGPFKQCLVGKADLKEELQKGWLKRWKWDDSAEALLKYWFGTGNRLDAQVYESVSRLKKKGILCVLATNQEKYRTEYLNAEFDYPAVFNKIFSSAYVGAKKPQSEFFDKIFGFFKGKSQDIQKNELLFWDDDVKNVEGATEYGFTAAIYTDFESYETKMTELGLL